MHQFWALAAGLRLSISLRSRNFKPLNPILMIKHVLKISLGVILVLVGLIGGLVPIFQGWIFGIPGLIILANYFPPAKRLLNWSKNKAGLHKKDYLK